MLVCDATQWCDITMDARLSDYFQQLGHGEDKDKIDLSVLGLSGQNI